MSFLGELPNTSYWDQAYPDADRLASYIVHDIPCGEPQLPHVILLLESPHIVEVCRGYPLAGTSGSDVTAKLKQILNIPDDAYDCPFGEMLQLPDRDGYLNRFGIMNVSQLPMQSTAYLCPMRRAFGKVLFDRFKTLRQAGAVARQNRHRGTRQIKELMINDLKDRVRSTRTDAYIIPCGDVAKAFFNCVNDCVPRDHTALPVPHPSRGQWRRPVNQPVLNQLRQEIYERLQ